MNDSAATRGPVCRTYRLRMIGAAVVGLLLLAGMTGFAADVDAQSINNPPSVMDRIQDKARQRNAATSAGWFERLDSNRDGKISRAELQTSISRRFGLLDTDRSGTISRNEYAARKTSPDRAGPSFDQLDADRNGILSVAEFSAPVLWRFARLDGDGDGSLSRLETARYLNMPASRSLPPLSGKCFEIDGRFVIVSPERAEAYENTGRSQIDCAWQPGTLPVR